MIKSTTTRKSKPDPNKANILLNKFNPRNDKRPSAEMDGAFSVHHTAGAKWISL